ncbi:MAG TPA: prephenate dehydrogenase/arogenate dehydrogenase family protein [Candidatus Saccharimonadales bacterium]|nr:prephenate dehydrogenase/arogenate dehydrogenase family protein [Candidatus Saccharimonadales bacterium]
MVIGIIGYGSFGKLLAELLSKNISVAVYDKNEEIEEKTNIKKVSFEEIIKCDAIILAVNLDDLEEVCASLAGKTSENTIVVEVCSSKTKTVEILQKNLQGKCQYLATHPLFGPQSLGGSKTKKIVICESSLKDKAKVYNFLSSLLNLQVIEMSAEEHDRQMAWVHSLTFFVGRGLRELDLAEFELKTDYYQKLLDLVELENHHSIELFNTVQRGNPYSKEIREKFVSKLKAINDNLDGADK